MRIEFHGEAGESFDNAVNRMEHFIVQLTTEAGETFDAELLGSDPDAGWHGTVKYRRYDKETGEPTGDVLSAVVTNILVY